MIVTNATLSGVLAHRMIDAMVETDMEAPDERYAATQRARAMLAAAIGVLTADMHEHGESHVMYGKLICIANTARERGDVIERLAVLPQEQREAWAAHQRGEAVALRLLPHNGFDCYADTHGGTCGYPLLIDGSCPNKPDHLVDESR